MSKKGTLNSIIFISNESAESDVEMFGYTDGNGCGDKNDRKSNVGYVFVYG